MAQSTVSQSACLVPFSPSGKLFYVALYIIYAVQMEMQVDLYVFCFVFKVMNLCS